MRRALVCGRSLDIFAALSPRTPPNLLICVSIRFLSNAGDPVSLFRWVAMTTTCCLRACFHAILVESPELYNQVRCFRNLTPPFMLFCSSRPWIVLHVPTLLLASFSTVHVFICRSKCSFEHCHQQGRCSSPASRGHESAHEIRLNCCFRIFQRC